MAGLITFHYTSHSPFVSILGRPLGASLAFDPLRFVHSRHRGESSSLDQARRFCCGGPVRTDQVSVCGRLHGTRHNVCHTSQHMFVFYCAK